MRKVLLCFGLLGLFVSTSVGFACEVTIEAPHREIYGGFTWHDPGATIKWTLNCPVTTPESPWQISGTRYLDAAFYPPSEIFFPPTNSQGGTITITTPIIIGLDDTYNVHIQGGTLGGGAINSGIRVWAARRPPAPAVVGSPQCAYSVDEANFFVRYNPVNVTVSADDPDTEPGYSDNLTFAFDLTSPSVKSKKRRPAPSSTSSFSFTPLKRGEHVLRSTAFNGTLPSTVTTETRITCPNRPPLAKGTAQTTFETSVNVNLPLEIASVDSDGDPLTVAWSVAGKPDGANATLDLFPFNPKAAVFKADKPGEYRVRALASDNQGASSAPVEYIVNVVGAFSPSIALRDGQIYKDSVAYLKTSLGLPGGAPIPSGLNVSWEIRKPDDTVLAANLVKFDDPTTGADDPGPNELYPFFAVPEVGIYSAKVTASAPNYRTSSTTFSFLVTDSSVLIFREFPPFSIMPPRNFYDLLVPGINHVGFYWSLDDVVYESTPGGGTRNLFNPLVGAQEAFATPDGVQGELPKPVFAHNSPTADRLHDTYVEVPISIGLASPMAGFILGKMGKGYTPLEDLIPFRNLSTQKGTNSTNERYSCAGLVERAAEVAGLNGGQGFMPRVLEEAVGSTPGEGILLPSTLLWSIKHPSLAFSPKLINVLITLLSIRSPVFLNRTEIETPVDFVITDPVGRKIEIRTGIPVVNEIANAFVSGKGDIIASAVPEAMNGIYRIELIGRGADVQVSVGIGVERFYFKGMLNAGQTVSGEITVSDQNLPPIANAGPDRMVFKNQTTVLDGSTSHDPELKPLTFNWEILSAPKNSTALVEGSSQAIARIVPDKTGTYTFRFTVSDGVRSVSDDVRLVAVPSESRPLLDVNVDQVAVRVGERAFFAASTWYIPSNSKEMDVDVEAESEGIELRAERVSDTSFKVEGLLNKSAGTKNATFRLYQQNARQTRGIKEARRVLWEKLAEIELALEEEKDPDRRIELLKIKDNFVRERAQLKEALEQFRTQMGLPVTKTFEVLP